MSSTERERNQIEEFFPRSCAGWMNCYCATFNDLFRIRRFLLFRWELFGGYKTFGSTCDSPFSLFFIKLSKKLNLLAKFQLIFSISLSNLFLCIDGDGFSFRIIEAIHGADVHDHGESAWQNHDKEDDDEERSPDGGWEEANAVVVTIGELCDRLAFFWKEQRLDLDVGEDDVISGVGQLELDASVRSSLWCGDWASCKVSSVVVSESFDEPSSSRELNLHADVVCFAWLQVHRHCGGHFGRIESYFKCLNIDNSFADCESTQSHQEVGEFEHGLVLGCDVFDSTCSTNERLRVNLKQWNERKLFQLSSAAEMSLQRMDDERCRLRRHSGHVPMQSSCIVCSSMRLLCGL